MNARVDFAWQGLRLSVPDDWNLGRVDGDFEKGYARLDDAEIVRAEIEWRRLKGRGEALRLTELVDRYLANLQKKAQKVDAPFEVQRRARFLKNKKFLEGREYEVFIWEADFRAYNLALALKSGRVVLLRVLAKLDEFFARASRGRVQFARRSRRRRRASVERVRLAVFRAQRPQATKPFPQVGPH